MQYKIPEIVDIHKGKTFYVVGLGPSTNSHIPRLTTTKDNADEVVISCNTWDILIPEIHIDYWVLANPCPSVKVMNNIQKHNKYPNTTVVWARIIDNSDIDMVNKLLIPDHIPYYERDNPHERMIKNYLCEYTSWHECYFGGTVAAHMIALAILMGAKKILVSGIDLDYSGGYAGTNAGTSPASLAASQYEISQYINGITDSFKTLYLCAKNVNCNIISLSKSNKFYHIIKDL